MLKLGGIVLAAVLACASALSATQAQTPAAPAAAMPAPRVDKIADGVFVAMRPEPGGIFLDANSVFIVGSDDVIVVDTNATPSSARASIAALRKISTKPVSAVINTHGHQDHINGNQAYREAYPKAEFIMHAAVTQRASEPGVSNRAALMTAGPQLVAEMRMSLDQGKSMGGGALGDEERESHLADIERAQRFLVEAASLEPVAPGRLVQDRLTLTQGARTIEILALGRGHSAADLVVHLPRERVVIAGDLVTLPVPIIPSSAVPSEFVKSLNALLALKAAIIVPGHGDVQRDDARVRQEIRLLESLLQQVRTAVAGGATQAQVRVMVNVQAARDEIAGASPMRGILFDLYTRQPGIAAAYREATK